MLAMRGLEQGDGGYRCHFVGADACIGPRANNVRPYTPLHGTLWHTDKTPRADMESTPMELNFTQRSGGAFHMLPRNLSLPSTG